MSTLIHIEILVQSLCNGLLQNKMLCRESYADLHTLENICVGTYKNNF